MESHTAWPVMSVVKKKKEEGRKAKRKEKKVSFFLSFILGRRRSAWGQEGQHGVEVRGKKKEEQTRASRASEPGKDVRLV